MNISSFFANILGTSLRNSRWSWGSYDSNTGRVFLRVWEDELSKDGSEESIFVLRSEPRRTSNGHQERKEHIEKIQNGASGFGILCVAVDPSTSGARKIKSFDDSLLLQFGKIHKKEEGFFAEITGRVNVTGLTSLASDLKVLIKSKLDSTEKEALINARIGQGTFRRHVLELWDNRCAVTGAKTLDAIRASHIKAWRYSNDEERLDPYNGFPLVASLDALFDSGLISFHLDGTIMVSNLLSESERTIFNLAGAKLAKKPYQENANYLVFHNTEIFHA